MKKTPPPPLHLPPDMGHVSAKRRRLFSFPEASPPPFPLSQHVQDISDPPPPSLFALPLPHEEEEAKNLAGKGAKKLRRRKGVRDTKASELFPPPLLKLTHVLRYVRCKGSREGRGLKKFPLAKWSRGRAIRRIEESYLCAMFAI